MVVTVFLFASNYSEAPGGPVQPVADKQSEGSAAGGSPVQIDLENDADFEQDADDFNAEGDITDDIDSSEFDEEAIDEGAF